MTKLEGARNPQIADGNRRQGNQMEARQPDTENSKQWESVHVCPQCGHPINLKDIGLPETSTGIIACSKCDWSGSIEIEIIKKRATE
jgi:ribosomal protein L37AE/L43A